MVSNRVFVERSDAFAYDGGGEEQEMRKHSISLALPAVSGLLWGLPTSATFHLWDISEVYSNADGTVQYIELFTNFNSQQFTRGHTIQASHLDASHVFVFPDDTPSPTAGRHLLLATAGFSDLPGAVTPDFTLDDGFLFHPDGVVDFVSANRMAYVGLPTDGVSALHCDSNNGISCTAMSVGDNSPTNFAGKTGFIDASGGGCKDTDGDGLCDAADPCAGGPASGDTDSDGSIDLADFVGFEGCLGGPGGALGMGCECFDFDADKDVDLANYGTFQEAFLEP